GDASWAGESRVDTALQRDPLSKTLNKQLCLFGVTLKVLQVPDKEIHESLHCPGHFKRCLVRRPFCWPVETAPEAGPTFSQRLWQGSIVASSFQLFQVQTAISTPILNLVDLALQAFPRRSVVWRDPRLA